MTPEHYIEQLKELVSSGQDRQAVQLSARLWPQLAPRLSLEELILVSGLMEGAETAVELEQARLATTDDQTERNEAVTTEGPVRVRDR
jgi:hypothetical protein